MNGSTAANAHQSHTNHTIQPKTSNSTTPDDSAYWWGPVALVGGEVVKLKGDRVSLSLTLGYGATRNGLGEVIITNDRLVFLGDKFPRIEISLLLITRIEKKEPQDRDHSIVEELSIQSPQVATIHLESKEWRGMVLCVYANSALTDGTAIIPDPVRQSSRLYECLMDVVFPRSPLQFFAFTHKLEVSSELDGWHLFNPVSEFMRQGLHLNSQWRVCDANVEYDLCDTYPRQVIVPASISDAEVRRSIEFRSKNRFPVLCWKHPHTDAAVCRSSQPLVGIFRARNSDDERLVSGIRRANAQATQLYIMDCRPRSNAMANSTLKGAGFENPEYYENCVVHFLGVDNIHVVRKCFQAVRDLVAHVSPNDERWLSLLEATGWLTQVGRLIAGVIRIVEVVEVEGASVLVHCSDGWDRTPQLVSLAQLLLDPFYRSLTGFQILIEKEWVAYGHKFAQRCAHGSTVDSEEVSQVFLLWVDAVWQLTQQYPSVFEFNEPFLRLLAHETYACRFGTLLFSSDKQRQAANVSKNTVSLWSHVNVNRNVYTNHHYKPMAGVLFPTCTPRRIRLWDGFFFRFENLFDRAPRTDTCGMPQMQTEVVRLQNLVREIETQRQEEKERHVHEIARHKELISILTKGEDNIASFCSVLVWEVMEIAIAKIEQRSAVAESSSSDDSTPRPAARDPLGALKPPSPGSPEGRELRTGSEIRSRESIFRRIATTAPSWIPDVGVAQCFKCKAAFTVFFRRHHCRSCGRIFCHACSSKKCPLPELNMSVDVRVCDLCYYALQTGAKGSASRRRGQRRRGGAR